MGDSGRKHIDPRLLALIDKSESEPGIFMEHLMPGDVLEVQTRNTLYTMRVVDPKNGHVRIKSNGKYFVEETDAWIWGSSLTGTGTMVKVGWIAPGYCLRIGALVLSTTQEVRINGAVLLPKTESS